MLFVIKRMNYGKMFEFAKYCCSRHLHLPFAIYLCMFVRLTDPPFVGGMSQNKNTVLPCRSTEMIWKGPFGICRHREFQTIMIMQHFWVITYLLLWISHHDHFGQIN